MAGTLPAPPPFQPDPLARAGLLGAHTMLARRKARPDFAPTGGASGPSRLRSEQFGFSAALPFGWTRQHGEAFLAQPYGLISFQDIEVLTPSGARARIGASMEPVTTCRDAIDQFADLYVEASRGRLLSRAPLPRALRAELASSVDLTIALESCDLLLCRLFVEGPRVLCVETLHSAELSSDDDAMKAVLDGFELLVDPDAPYRSAFTSGTYRIR